MFRGFGRVVVRTLTSPYVPLQVPLQVLHRSLPQRAVEYLQRYLQRTQEEEEEEEEEKDKGREVHVAFGPRELLVRNYLRQETECV
jgi:hypothetical protein